MASSLEALKGRRISEEYLKRNILRRLHGREGISSTFQRIRKKNGSRQRRRGGAFQAEESSPWKKRGTSFYRKLGLAFHRGGGWIVSGVTL